MAWSMASSATRIGACGIRPGHGLLQWCAGALPGRCRHGRHLPVRRADHRAQGLNSSAHFNFQLASGETGSPGYNVWVAIWACQHQCLAAHDFVPEPQHLGTGVSDASTAPYISRQMDGLARYGITRDLGFDRSRSIRKTPGPGARASASSPPCLTCRSTSMPSRPRRQALAGAWPGRCARDLARHRGVLPAPAGAHGPCQCGQVRALLRGAGLRPRGEQRVQRVVGSLTALENWAEKSTSPPHK